MRICLHKLVLEGFQPNATLYAKIRYNTIDVKTTTQTVLARPVTTLEFDRSSVTTELTVADIGSNILHLEIWEASSSRPLMSSACTAEPLLKLIGYEHKLKIVFGEAGAVGGGGGSISFMKRDSDVPIQNMTGTNVGTKTAVLFASAHRLSLAEDKEDSLKSAVDSTSKNITIGL